MAERHEHHDHHHTDGGTHAGIYILLVFVIALILGGFWWFASDRGQATDEPEIELNLPEGESPDMEGEVEVPEG